MIRTASIERNTAETQICLSLNLDGTGKADVATGIPFFDHMLTLLARHGLFDLTVRAKGDTDVDYHHTVEDVGIVLGNALRRSATSWGFAVMVFSSPLWMNVWHASRLISGGGRTSFTRWRRRIR